MNVEDNCLSTGPIIAGTPSRKIITGPNGGRFSNLCDVTFQDPKNTGSYGLMMYANTDYYQPFYQNGELWATNSLTCGETFLNTYKVIKVSNGSPSMLFGDTLNQNLVPC
ncbi:hypothetical protein BC939DRAFT_477170 [Gamsiella multidivaricata]|uniref:uncharacterized protein n=1 Tax=Gamsiella multidivaricata TaxID=101098 RepID=UPI00221F68CB|nr:uncharacterized protein BC939DRAFT_477170 [Gamsiella multidivaricata]KAI7823635.1 hypothetical protein BC939DRAFT_477170 [Gamsiella multidivaricata]